MCNFSICILAPTENTKNFHLLKHSSKKLKLSDYLFIPAISESDRLFLILPDNLKFEQMRSTERFETIYFDCDGNVRRIEIDDKRVFTLQQALDIIEKAK